MEVSRHKKNDTFMFITNKISKTAFLKMISDFVAFNDNTVISNTNTYDERYELTVL